jgi:molecular chaperone GrpE
MFRLARYKRYKRYERYKRIMVMKDKKPKKENPDQTKEEIVQESECPKCAEYLAGWKRAVADYENLKRQTAEDKMHFAEYAHEQLLNDLLPAVDQFETALKFLPNISELPDPQKQQIENWLVGIKAVRQLWEQSFNEIGLTKIPIDCEFDPNLHTAISQESDPEQPDGAILKVIQIGYKLKDNVLRPAKVVVNKHKPS